MPTTILTDIGEAKLATAAGNQTQVAISHIALGDGQNSAAYDPVFAQAALKGERVRKAIDSRAQIAAKSWQVKAVFGPETDAFMVREIGFFDDDGDLIALWAGADVNPRQTGIVEYVVDHVLHFSRVADGLIIVTAPDDALFSHAITNIQTHAILAREQFNQRLLIEGLRAQMTA